MTQPVSTQPNRVSLYYREKRGVRFDEGYTEWMLMLSNATREEALAFMARFDWSRSDWNTIGVEHTSGGGSMTQQPSPLPQLWPGFTTLRLPNQVLLRMAILRITIDALYGGPSENWNPDPASYPGGTVCHYEPEGVE